MLCCALLSSVNPLAALFGNRDRMQSVGAASTTTSGPFASVGASEEEEVTLSSKPCRVCVVGDGGGGLFGMHTSLHMRFKVGGGGSVSKQCFCRYR